MASEQKLGRVGDTPWAVVTTRAPGVLKISRIDKVPRPSISNVIWILSFDTICQLNQLFSNSEAAILSTLEWQMLS